LILNFILFKKGERIYPLEDIGFRWRKTLNVKYKSTVIDADCEHYKLKKDMNICKSGLQNKDINIMTSCIQVIFKDFSKSSIPIEARNFLNPKKKKKKI